MSEINWLTDNPLFQLTNLKYLLMAMGLPDFEIAVNEDSRWSRVHKNILSSLKSSSSIWFSWKTFRTKWRFETWAEALLKSFSVSSIEKIVQPMEMQLSFHHSQTLKSPESFCGEIIATNLIRLNAFELSNVGKIQTTWWSALFNK